MTKSSTLRKRIISDIFSTDTLVTLVAIIMAAITVGFSWIQGTKFVSGFLLLMSIGVNIPSVYEKYWPVEYTEASAIVWTVGVSIVTVALFVLSQQLLVLILEPILIAVAAFIVTSAIQFGGAIGYQRIHSEHE